MAVPSSRELTPSTFVERLTLPIWQATAAVRWLEGRVRNRPKLTELRPEKAALTDADCVSQEILLVALREAFPDVGLYVEEDTPSVEEFANGGDPEAAHVVLIDPIDGTLRFLRGDGPYAILVGLERRGLVEAALVGLPKSRLLLRAVRGKGAEIASAGGAFEPLRASPPGARVLVSYGLPDPVRSAFAVQGLQPRVAAGGAIGVAPLLDETLGGLRLAATSDGLSRRAWVAALPLLEAGGRIEALDGSFPERYEPGVMGLLTANTNADLARLRALLG